MSAGRRKKPRLHERVIAALLTEPTRAAAATKAGVSEATIGRWLKDAAFAAAFRQARRDLVKSAVERLQSAVGEAVETLRTVTRDGAKDGDRVRAAAILIEYAFRGIEIPAADLDGADQLPVKGTADVVRLLAARLGQLETADIPIPEKARLTATLADAMLRAIATDVIDKRLESLQAVLQNRKDA